MSHTKPDSRIIVALDNMDRRAAMELMAELDASVRGGKANDLLDEFGAKVLNDIMEEHGVPQGMANLILRVRMADPKIKDIPNTVYNRVMRYHGRADLLTVHGTCSWKALKRAVEARDAKPDSGLKLIAISVTTDVNEKQCRKIYGMSSKRKVLQIAQRAKAAGFDGIVCSPQEVALVRQVWPKAIIICPSVRSVGADTHDQERVDTPAKAIANGATYVVCGREITEAEDKPAAANRINEDVGQMLAAQDRIAT